MTEKEIEEKKLKEIEEKIRKIKTRTYNRLKENWRKPILFLLLVEATGLIIYGLIIYIKIPLHSVDSGIPTLEYSEVATSLFQVAISVSGIILGFFAVCVFFMAEWKTRVTERCDEDFRIIVEGIIAGLSQYAELFVKVTISLLLMMIMSFLYCSFSGVFVFLSMVLNLNSVIIISSGLYPLVNVTFSSVSPFGSE